MPDHPPKRTKPTRQTRTFVLASLLTMIVAGCTTTPAPATKPAATQATGAATTQPAADRVVRDLAYKSSPTLSDYERSRCKLDLYLPDAKNFATVVWFYGGGLESGSKDRPLHVGIANTLAGQGVACAVVDYRLSPQATYPAYLDDAAGATAWVLAHIKDHGGDPNRVFVSGHSAGAYLATMVGFDQKYLAHYRVSTNRLAGIVPVSPQVFTHFTIRKERGVKAAESQPAIDEAAPAYHARADAPPTLILIGDDDWPARLEECQYFITFLTKVIKHPDAQLAVIPDRTHGSIAGKARSADDPTTQAMLAFIRKHSAVAN